jgi:hypothetical protein
MLGRRITQVAAPMPLRAKIAKIALRHAVAWAGRAVVVMVFPEARRELRDGRAEVESIRSKRFDYASKP